jgi:purine nucleosidase/pyrimidine-specific ribonucleoside hydrolase
MTAITPRPVVLDTDPGVDDALALLLALRSPELRVELIMTVAGNVPIAMATSNARHILGLVDAPAGLVLAQGASRPLRRPLHTATAVHGHDGLGGLTELRRPDGSLWYPAPQRPVVHRQAVTRLLQLVQRYGQDLTVIALGPLTNIARAIQHDPHTMQQLGRLIIMGGAISVPGNVSPTAEFNIFVDPHAADVVFRAGLPIVLVPLDVTRQVRLTSEFLGQTIHGQGTRLAQATRQMTHQALHGPHPERGMPMHDPLAVAVAIEASLVGLETLPLGVETRGQQTLGMTVADRRAPAYWSAAMPRAEVALTVDAPRVLELFATRVLT